MSSRTARNSLLAAAAAIGVVAAVLQVVSTSLSFGDFLTFPTRTSLRVASGIGVLAWVFVLAAFGAALVGFLLRSRRSRTTVLAVSAGLFVGYGLSTLAATLIDLVQSLDFSEPWEFTASQSAGVAGGAAVAISALLVLIGVLSARPERLLGWASVGLAAHFALSATAYSFELAGFLSAGFSPPARFSWGLGTAAGGYLVASVAAVVAARAFFVSNERRKRGERWQAEREGSLGVAAAVFAVGFLLVAVGLMLYSSLGGSTRTGIEEWFQAGAQLLLAFAAVCGAVGFLLSRRDADRRRAALTAA